MKRVFGVAAILVSLSSGIALAENPTENRMTHPNSQPSMQPPASGCPKQADWNGSTGDDRHTNAISSGTAGSGAGRAHSVNISSATGGAGAGKATPEACANGKH